MRGVLHGPVQTLRQGGQVMVPNYRLIPARTMSPMVKWVTVAQPTGDFLYAVLTNNLKEACNRADDENIEALYHIVCWLYNHAPLGCWGSVENVKGWQGWTRETPVTKNVFEMKWMDKCAEET